MSAKNKFNISSLLGIALFGFGMEQAHAFGGGRSNPPPPPPKPQASCAFNNTNIASGSSITAYKTASVPYGSSCLSEKRSCSNGALSGSYTYSNCTVAQAPTPPASKSVWTPIDASWKLTFDEEFNGTQVDSTKWGTNWLGAPGAITKPINSAEIGAYDPAQVSVSGGKLHLAAIAKQVKAADGKTYDYASGIVQSFRKFEQAFGYIEARIYLPGSNGKIHNFPAFWMNGDHSRYGQSWPYAGELDIMEGLGGGYAQYHFHSPTTHAGGGPKTDFTGWHVYAALWERGMVTYYYDGVQVGRLNSGITEFPMYLILNNGLSLEHGGALSVPSTMQVDYVHVYSNDPAAKAVAPQPGYGGPGYHE